MYDALRAWVAARKAADNEDGAPRADMGRLHRICAATDAACGSPDIDHGYDQYLEHAEQPARFLTGA
jgi:hypothetical protein